MKNLKVVKIDSDFLMFDNGVKLSSHHDQGCCESHYLSFDDLIIDDFEGIEFDLTTDSFFKKIDGYGIELTPINGHPVRIPGYGYNNGYYGTNLSIILTDEKGFSEWYDISECQVIQQ